MKASRNPWGLTRADFLKAKSGLANNVCTLYTYHVYSVHQMTRLTKAAPAKTNTAAAILAAAREILDREGIAAIAMRPIAERAGITPMAIYRHYKDRASLLKAIADAGFRELGDRMQALKLRGEVEARLRQVGGIVLDTALEFPNLYELMFLAPRDDARVYPDDFKAGRSPTFNPAVKILEEAMRAGELRPDDPIEIAFELGALQHGLILLYRGGRVAQTEKQFRKLHQRSFRRYLNALRP